MYEGERKKKRRMENKKKIGTARKSVRKTSLWEPESLIQIILLLLI